MVDRKLVKAPLFLLFWFFGGLRSDVLLFTLLCYLLAVIYFTLLLIESVSEGFPSYSFILVNMNKNRC